MRKAVLAIVVLVVLIAGAGAAFVVGSRGGDGGGAGGENGTRFDVYVAIGASDTVGVGADDPATEAWPAVFHSLAVPGARYVNVGVSGTTVNEALDEQLPKAVRADPDVVTVWLAANDLIALVPVEEYERQLRGLLRRLTRDPDRLVLVANLPPLDRLPAYTECLPPRGERCRIPFDVPGAEVVDQFVRTYNAAIGRAAERAGAVLVDLYAAGHEARAAGTDAGHVAPDGFHPSTAGHRAIAEEFAESFRRAVSRTEQEVGAAPGYSYGYRYGSVIAPRSAPVTSRAYFASTPVV